MFFYKMLILNDLPEYCINSGECDSAKQMRKMGYCMQYGGYFFIF